jgi:hypothetical protein
MRVVSAQSEADIRRRKAREALTWPLRELTANLLRIAKRGGRPSDLFNQMAACSAARRLGKGVLVGVRCHPEFLATVDRWRAAQPRQPGLATGMTRPQAIRALAELALERKAN